MVGYRVIKERALHQGLETPVALEDPMNKAKHAITLFASALKGKFILDKVDPAL